MGKGRTIAGLILENWRCGRNRHLWISIGSDLRVDARRDLNDANGEEIEIHALNKLQYGQLDSDKVHFLWFQTSHCLMPHAGLGRYSHKGHRISGLFSSGL